VSHSPKSPRRETQQCILCGKRAASKGRSGSAIHSIDEFDPAESGILALFGGHSWDSGLLEFCSLFGLGMRMCQALLCLPIAGFVGFVTNPPNRSSGIK
jgi:hypothetical protein